MRELRAPRLSRWLLSLALHPDDRRFALADLDEDLERQAAAQGPARARRWYRAQVVRSIVPALRDRWARRPRNLLVDAAQDVRFALRTLAKTPLTATITIVSLAIGITVTTAVFGVANALLFRGPSGAIQEPERLVALYTSTNEGTPYGQNSFQDYLDIADQMPAFDGVVAQRVGLVRIDRQDGTERRVIAEIVTGNYFDVLGVTLPVGRAFRPDETVVGAAERLVVISRRLWEEEFDSDPQVMGRTLELDGDSFTVTGVAPSDLISRILALRTDVWVPIGIPGGVFRSDEKELATRSDRNYGILGRLAPGVGIETAQAQAEVTAARLHDSYPAAWEDDREAARSISVLPERQSRVPPDFFPALMGASSVVLFAACLILAIACSNVAGVMLAQADRRRQEMAVRLALGARRARVVRMLLTESLMLAIVAGGVGVWASTALTSRFNRISLPIGGIVLEFDLRADWRVLAFGLGIAVLTSLGAGLLPALQATRRNFVPALRGVATDAGGRVRRLQPRNAMVVVQVAVALIFVVGTGVTLRSFGELVEMDWGVNPDRIAVMSKEVPDEVGEESLVPWLRETQARLAADPAVEAVAIGRTAEGSMIAIDSQAAVEVAGYERASDEVLRFPVNAVSPGYIEMMGIRMVAGRTFTEGDDAGSPPVAVVNQSFADRFWSGQSAIGQRFRILGKRSAGDGLDVSDGRELEIVGVAADARYQGFESSGQVYFWTPLYQGPARLITILARGRTSADPGIALLRREVDPADREVTLISPQPYVELMNYQFLFLRFLGETLAWGAAFGMFLAMLGLYGVVSYAVSRRSREMAIRQAVGARPAEAMRVVLGDGLRLTLWGMGAGLLVVVPVSALLRADIHGVSPIEPVSAIVGVLLLLGAAAAASWVPARRATHLDPVASLRQE